MKKISRNRERDEENYEKLRSLGWKVVVVWECELRDPLAVLSELKEALCE